MNAVQAGEDVDAVTCMIHYFNSWTHLRKSMAWILRFKTWLLSLSHKRRQRHMTLAQSDLDEEQQQHTHWRKIWEVSKEGLRRVVY